MKSTAIQILILIFVSTILSYGQVNSWNNLLPLRSTRADVEKLLGKPKDNTCSFGCEYETAKEKIRVSYAHKKCDVAGWKVPADTVLSLTVSSKENSGKSFDELNLNRNKFTVDIDDILSQKWTNAEEGLIYSLRPGIQLKFDSITYIPKKTDNYLRCDGFPPETQYFTMNTTSFYNPALNKKEGLNMILSYTDSFIIGAMNEYTDFKGYVLVYFDHKLSFEEYKIRLNELKKHIFDTRKISPERLTVIEGGLREDSIIEFYTLSKEMKSPTPNPTLPSPQFMKKH